jgi:hypothetical protein
MRKRPLLYGWFDSRERLFRLSRLPPDAPIRPSIALTTLEEAKEVAARKKTEILWWPPLPMEAMLPSHSGEASMPTNTIGF